MDILDSQMIQTQVHYNKTKCYQSSSLTNSKDLNLAQVILKLYKLFPTRERDLLQFKNTRGILLSKQARAVKQKEEI